MTGPPARPRTFPPAFSKNWHGFCNKPDNSGFGAPGTGRPGNPHSYDRQADLQPPRLQKSRMQDSVAPGAARFQGALVQAGRGIPFFIHRRAGLQPPGFQRNPPQDSVASQSGRPRFRGPWYRQAEDSPLLFGAQADLQPPVPIRCGPLPFTAQGPRRDETQHHPLGRPLHPPAHRRRVQCQLPPRRRT